MVWLDLSGFYTMKLRYLSSVTSHQARNVIDDKIALLMIKWHHKIVKVCCGSIRLGPFAYVSWIHNTLTILWRHFIINKRTDDKKLGAICLVKMMSIYIYIYTNAKHVFAAYKIYVQVDIWGSRFILPHFNVIFNIYIADEGSIYIYIINNYSTRARWIWDDI